jgi:protein-tyrosine phosphatase
MSHVDLHLHLLPGVDDGPADLGAALAHAERLARDGVHEATVTPHVGHPDFPVAVATIPERTRTLQAAIDAAGIALRLHPGGEIFPDCATDLSPDELAVIAQGPAGARWVLLEVPFDGIDAKFFAAWRHVRRHGFGVLIAHPERAAGLLDEGLQRLRPVIEDGALLQVNVSSLLGRHGDEARIAGRRLIRDGLAYVLASDGHGADRPDTLAVGCNERLTSANPRFLAVGCNERLTSANPRFLLRHGIPAGDVPSRAWRSPYERRMHAAIRASRQRAQ